MTFNKQTEQNVLLFVCLIGLVALLTYTFVHTGSFLARYVHPPGVGYLAAFGVEIIIAGMAWRVSRGQTGSVLLKFALVAALVVSAFANVYEGYNERYGELLTLQNINRIDPVQAIVGLSATALISLLVFAISDIVGSDMSKVAKTTERKQRAEQKAEQAAPKPKQPKKPTEQTDYKAAVFNILANGETLGPRPMAERLNCSPATAKKWIDVYHKQANGSGKGVLSDEPL